LRLYNTRTRAVETFVPLDGDHVRIYVCGLTPSAEAHLGHARSFMFFDVLRRFLVHRGYRVTYVRNVTDIDDRSIAESRATGKPWRDVVAGYFASFTQSMARLHLVDPDHEPRATEYVPQIVEMIAALVDAGNAYAAPDGVYFSVSSFPRYGALSGRNTDELLIGARIAPDEGKRDPLDFVLWKFAKPGEPSWPSPWGVGRPGWHIECSAMSHALLGEPFDIHGGGYDLIFPHHENEIAQSESLVPPPMANAWVHGGLLLFDGKKMSKSLGNFEPLYALLDRHDPQAVRLLFLQSGYRKPMNFTEASIEGATTGLRRLQAAYDTLRMAPVLALDAVHESAATKGSRANGTDGDATHARVQDPRHHAINSVVKPYLERFEAALDDDMNTSGALSVLFDIASAAPELVRGGHASSVAAFVHEAMTILGISPNDRIEIAEAIATERVVTVGSASLRIAGRGAERLADAALADLRTAVGDVVVLDGGSGRDAIDAIVEARLVAKSNKDFTIADRLRVALASAGVTLADSKEGTSWSVDA
jgi:cysteinyl-tRNA synthetase